MRTEVTFTGSVPECPHCERPTKREFTGSSKTLMGWTVTYDEQGNQTNADPNVATQYWRCVECKKDFIVEGNAAKGWKYLPEYKFMVNLGAPEGRDPS